MKLKGTVLEQINFNKINFDGKEVPNRFAILQKDEKQHEDEGDEDNDDHITAVFMLPRPLLSKKIERYNFE